MKSLRNRIILILGILAACLYFTFPLQKRINLGLDLKGGMHLVLKVDTSKLSENAKKDAVLRAMEILRNRIDSMGVGETSIQLQGESEIVVQLPGITDRDRALSIIGKVAQLEFRLVTDDPTVISKALSGDIDPRYEIKYIKNEENRPILVEKAVALSGETVSDARVDFDQTGFGQPRISLTLNSEGAKTFGTITQENINRRLAIILDGEALSAPNIKEPILTGNAEITGMFTFDEANILALSLRSGALPAPMYVEEERTVGPLLGKDSIDAGIRATAIALISVLCFMLLFYFGSGMIANIALLLNLVMITGILGFLNVMMPGTQATLTLPGIAGIVLTLGMAVDANVLINERIREEVANGRPIQAAVANGFNKAFTAIFDSNVTTLVAAFMLFQFGSGPIKGFAITLTIGLVASMFTALFVSRALFDLSINARWIKAFKSLKFLTNTKFDFIALRYFCFALSIIVIAVCMYSFWVKRDTAFGVDFSGGQIQEYKFAKPLEAQELRAALAEGGVKNFVIQQFDKHPETVLIRSSEDSYDKTIEVFKTKFPNNQFEIMRVEKVGPVVGHLLRKRAMWAILLALAGILIYVGFRFKHFDFAAAGVIALLHDILVAIGFVVMTNRQIDLLVVTALLTIAGFSINDTIVIYDRVRENLFKTRKMSFREILNLSVNETLSRTVNTTATALLVVIILFIFGGEVLNTFSFTLLVGFIAGVYSTVFVASPLVWVWQRLQGHK